jgi:hypothetical protein
MEKLARDLLIYRKTMTQSDEPTGTSGATQCLQEALANVSGAIAESEAKITFDPLPCLSVEAVHLHQLSQKPRRQRNQIPLAGHTADSM